VSVEVMGVFNYSMTYRVGGAKVALDGGGEGRRGVTEEGGGGGRMVGNEKVGDEKSVWGRRYRGFGWGGRCVNRG